MTAFVRLMGYTSDRPVSRRGGVCLNYAQRLMASKGRSVGSVLISSYTSMDEPLVTVVNPRFFSYELWNQFHATLAFKEIGASQS